MPGIINFFKVKELESRFKKTDAMIQEALKISINELGYSSPGEIFYITNSWSNLPYPFNEQITNLNEIWLKQFNIVDKLPDSNVLCSKNIKISPLFGDATACNYSTRYFAGYILSNGSAISGIQAAAGWGGGTYRAGFAVHFDTNGPYKGPNRKGYDIFTYTSNKVISPVICNPTVNNSNNSDGCYFFARANQSPLNSSEFYWDLLYKPLSYWQNYKN